MTPIFLSRIEIINPVECRGWDDRVLGFPGASVFHSSGWARVLSESYGYRPVYFVAFRDGEMSDVLPVMEIRSFLTGIRGVSLPFSDFCPALARNASVSNHLIEAAGRFGKKRGWKHLDLRGAPVSDASAKPFSSYYRHTLDLRIGSEKLFAGCSSGNRRNIRKGCREGVSVRFSDTLEGVKSFYRLHCMTRKKHGVPVQPFFFFRKIYENLLSKGLGIISLATWQDKAIAGALYLHVGGSAVYKFGASDPRFLHLRPNNLVMWETIQRYVGQGIQTLSFGRTDLDHHGLLRFKREWGGNEERVNYYRYHVGASEFVPAGVRPGISRSVMEKMPAFALKAIGGLLYRHVG